MVKEKSEADLQLILSHFGNKPGGVGSKISEIKGVVKGFLRFFTHHHPDF